VRGNFRPPTKRELCLYRSPSTRWDHHLYHNPGGKRLVSRIYRPDEPISRKRYFSTLEYRAQVAIANNNQGTWWAAEAYYTARVLERMFLENKVPTLLQEVVGGIYPDPELEGEGYLYVQLSQENELVDVSLEDIRVVLLEEVAVAKMLSASP